MGWFNKKKKQGNEPVNNLHFLRELEELRKENKQLKEDIHTVINANGTISNTTAARHIKQKYKRV